MQDPAKPLTLVKLGGSLITDKQRPETARPEVIERLARELAAALGDPAGGAHVLLGHGSGSFGHVTAARYRIHSGIGEREQLPGVPLTQARAAELHRRVVAALAAAGALPFSLPPSAAAVDGAEDDDEGLRHRGASYATAPVARALALGLLPVVHGDVVLDRQRGATIWSTERVFLELARRLPAHGFRVTRALWLGATAGVLDDRGRTLPRIAPGTATAAGGAAGTDVTGGMRHRVESALALAALGVDSWIVDGRIPGLLVRALAGEPVPGTRVPAGE